MSVRNQAILAAGQQPLVSEMTPALLSRAWYQSSIGEFLATGSDAILGRLQLGSSGFEVVPEQTDAWQTQIELLKTWLAGLDGAILFEFGIPRMGRRIDAVLLLGAVVFVVEFKVGARSFERDAIDQVWDYALDLKNFHEASHAVPVIPMLVATDATASPSIRITFADDLVATPIGVNPAAFRATVEHVVSMIHEAPIDSVNWMNSRYRPTPTIIDAARVLYARHSVEEIARNDAGALNLHRTSRRVEDLVADAQASRRKVICFVTGVPGAGKTLVGLNVAARGRDVGQAIHATYLSGNAPLVAVLSEALRRDERERQKRSGEMRGGRVADPTKAFIQIVHHFRDEALAHMGPPDDHVVIFDEAQRAWNRQKTSTFMKLRKRQPNFAFSEPEFLIKYMDRHQDWAVIVCLVGGGQEIHTGEAGIGEWLDAAVRAFPHWHLHISSQLTEAEYAAGQALATVQGRANTHLENDLHLAVSMRSFRSENVSEFVKVLLDCETGRAKKLLSSLTGLYPVVVTRDLARAKRWIREHSRGSERHGLVASSKAMRLKPHAIDIRADVNPVHWFLNDRDDTRSSYYLEDCATEFQVQGLELDWTCVSWDGDLRRTGAGWSYHDFRGKRWQKVRNPSNQNYLRNAYRVLLTRARQGMVLFIPPGDESDPTRLPEFYSPTFEYLAGIGIPVLQ